MGVEERDETQADMKPHVVVLQSRVGSGRVDDGNPRAKKIQPKFERGESRIRRKDWLTAAAAVVERW